MSHACGCSDCARDGRCQYEAAEARERQAWDSYRADHPTGTMPLERLWAALKEVWAALLATLRREEA